jgi:hypothetical protein
MQNVSAARPTLFSSASRLFSANESCIAIYIVAIKRCYQPNTGLRTANSPASPGLFLYQHCSFTKSFFRNCRNQFVSGTFNRSYNVAAGDSGPSAHSQPFRCSKEKHIANQPKDVPTAFLGRYEQLCVR